MIKILFVLSLLFCLSSCIELIDDITIHANGTGTLKYSINLSSSKVKVHSMLALDSLNGIKMLNQSELQLKITQFKETLSKQPGISNVVVSYDFVECIFKIICDFDNVSCLQTAIESTISIIFNKKADSNPWIINSNNMVSRNIPNIAVEQLFTSDWTNHDLLKTGTYTSITRFDTPIKSYDNHLSKISKSGKSLMLQINTDELFKNLNLLENTIKL
jgi:hypothetical protein